MIGGAFMSIAQRLYSQLNDPAVVAEHKKTNFIALFNDQFNRSNEEHTIPQPAILIEFLPLDWDNKSGGIQKADCTIRVHIGYHSIAEARYNENNIAEALKFDDYCDKVHAALQGFVATGIEGAMSRQQTFIDVARDHIIVTQMDYLCQVKDCAAQFNRDHVELTPDYKVEDDTIQPTSNQTPYKPIKTV